MINRISVATGIFVLAAFIVAGCASRKDVVEIKMEPNSPLEIARQHSAYEHYINALLHEENQQYELAIEELKAALHLDPHSLEINYELASILFQMRQFETAFELRNNVREPDAKFSLMMGQLAKFRGNDSLASYYFKTVLKFEPENYTALQVLSAGYLEKGQPESALPLLKKMILIRPEDTQASALLGQVYNSLGQYDSALTIFTAILNDNPYDRSACAGLGAVYQNAGQVEKALEIYSRITDRYPSDLAFQSMKFNAEISLGNYDAALKTGQFALQVAPDNREFLLSVVQLLLSKNDFHRSEDLLNTYVEIVPRDQGVKLLLGRILISEDKFQAADSLLVGLITENDSLSEAYMLQALSQVRQRQSERAIMLLTVAIHKVHDKAVLYNQMGNIHNSNQQYHEALSCFEMAVQQDPKNTAFKIALAEASDRVGDFKRAEKTLKELIRLEPENGTALNNLAYMYINHKKNLGKAEDYLKRALKLDPENGAFLDSYGWLLFHQGQAEEAISYVLRALDKVGSDPEVYDHLGDIYRQLKNNDRSLEYYQKALELAPNNKSIRAKVDSLTPPIDSQIK